MSVAIFVFGSTPLNDKEADEPPEQPQPSRHGDEIWFDGGPPDKELRSTMARLHNNLGHPDTPTMIRMLLAANATDKALEAARALKCAVCMRAKAPHASKPAKIHRVGSLNMGVALDVIFQADAAGTTFRYLSILKLSGLLHVVVQVGQGTGTTASTTCW